MVLDKRVSEPQNAFVRGRQILDSLLITNECLDSHIRYNIPRVLCMLDLRKPTIMCIGISSCICFRDVGLILGGGSGFFPSLFFNAGEWNLKWLCSKLTG